ncbi:MAG TPA: sulfurtransferase [Burkholderiales bacterium]|nr:sulfurtransferase [Burkholderiales bacterium]
MSAPRTLVSTKELAAHPEWRVFDCRHDLARPDWGFEAYGKAHIPGAQFAHLDRDLSGPLTGGNGRHPLPDLKDFIAWMGERGLGPTDTVVCYDAGSGAMAARLWWMLRWAGHESAAVLDGGLAKWEREGRPLSADLPEPTATRYRGEPRKSLSVGLAALERGLRKAVLLDARAPARYRGEQEPIDPVAGRIPGALNRFNHDNLQPDGTFKSPEELKADFLKVLGERPAAKVIHYCGSGVAACHNVLAMEIAGLAGSRVYAGSWSEWCADPSRPISRSA